MVKSRKHPQYGHWCIAWQPLSLHALCFRSCQFTMKCDIFKVWYHTVFVRHVQLHGHRWTKTSMAYKQTVFKACAQLVTQMRSCNCEILEQLLQSYSHFEMILIASISLRISLQHMQHLQMIYSSTTVDTCRKLEIIPCYMAFGKRIECEFLETLIEATAVNIFFICLSQVR